mmetsp:Transcript_5761/g.13133  ORF Transcript_5761/g.13133 Transcript_5761/m.13133 type:complete len:725 (+) Transcript_5761:416-2590(+)|eukprot:CAMPEP_0172300596 /NCGR_PEP_ID=MMETSP1058-20130122/2646_1 /TAXON_ID=83371 /ORGANISM="Detonula confervacea, Strain CCMP 353" /LENGTH=724 /DNA_ID=CAMNT_0013010419 /DNA_START=406 /DNA_END=2580 /DNA_ORIENTATION=-
MKYLEDSRLTQLTSDLTGAFLNTRGSGNGIGLIGNSSRNNNSRRSSGGKGKGNKKGKNKQEQKPSSGSSAGSGSGGGSTTTPRKNKSSTSNNTASAYYSYNPVGYSTYNNNGGGMSSSSCRVIYGRVEAYTTKRAGSDKKTAFEVGERYAHEMERLNEAVESLKRKHALEQEQEKKDNSNDLEDDIVEGDGKVSQQDGGGGRNKKIERRRRSRSMDGVTFATKASPKIVYDRSANTAAMMDTDSTGFGSLMPLEEGAVYSEDMQDKKEGITSQHDKREMPLEGILKQSTSNKRCRATSFDIATGPSTVVGTSPRRYHHSESSSSLLAESTWGNSTNIWGNMLPLSVVHPSGASAAMAEEDRNTHPLIPQPSLYQSSLSEHQASINGEKATAADASKSLPTMVPRRLVTDLILTLNASFPDYDFGDAQVSDFCTLSQSEAMHRINKQLSEFAATTDEGRDFLPRFWNSLDDVLFGGLKDCEVYSYAPKGSTGEDDPMEFLTMSMAAANENGPGVAGSDGGADGVIGEQDAVMFSPSDGGRIVSGDSLGGLNTSMALNLPSQIISSPSAASSDAPHVTLWSMNYFFVSRNKKRIVLFACVQTMRTPQGNDDDDADDCDEYEYGENNLVFDEARRGIRMQEEENNEDEYDTTYPLAHMSNMIGSSNSNNADFSSSTRGDESVSVMVEDTDFDDRGVDVDGDDVDECENDDFDTGTLGISVSVPYQVS